MADQFEKAKDDYFSMVKDYFDIGETETQTLMKVIVTCAKTCGVVIGGTVGVAMAGVGAVTIPGIGAVPGWVAGALAGLAGGTTACVIARGAIGEAAKRALLQSGRTEAEFKEAVRVSLKNPIMPMNHPSKYKPG